MFRSVHFCTPNLEEIRKFYALVLGMEFHPNPEGEGYVMTIPSGVRFSIASGDYVHIVLGFEVENLSLLLAQFGTIPGMRYAPIIRDARRVVVCYDPDGHRVELTQFNDPFMIPPNVEDPSSVAQK